MINIYDLIGFCEALLCSRKEKGELELFLGELERLLETQDGLYGSFNRILDIDGVDMAVQRAELAPLELVEENLCLVSSSELKEKIRTCVSFCS